jgi:transposase-like protein
VPEVKQQIVAMSLNASGMRDTARVLYISPNPVLLKRLVRKTIYFSKSIQMHDVVIGLFVNRYTFGRAV